MTQNGKSSLRSLFSDSLLGDDHFAERALHASDQTLAGKPPSLVTIIEAVAKEYNIEPASLSSPLKIRPQTEARAIVAMIVQETVGITLTSLAEELERETSSLSKSGERVRKRIKSSSLLQERVKRIMSEITNRVRLSYLSIFHDATQNACAQP